MSQERYFLENTWYAAAWEWEVEKADNKLARTICDIPLVFYKSETEGYVALDNRCCHRAAPLSLGRVEGNCLRCMYHGMLFNPEGKVVNIPGQDHIASTMAVRSYRVSAKGGLIWIWMGDPALADENDIHDFAPLSQPDEWRGFDRGDYLHYDANWLLIVDNLSDFSHVAFVHANTLGGSEAYAYDTNIENLEKVDNGFRAVRWHHDSLPPPFHKKVIPEAEHDTPIDRCNSMAMYIPGVFLMETLFAPAGWSEKDNDRSQCREYRNCQFMTPETRNTTHFFWDYLHNRDRDNPAITQSLKESFIEEQQKLLVKSPDFVPRSFSADEAFTHFRMRWKAKLSEENNNNPLPEPKENKRRIL
ncbi:aromatic ring-hydroxylating dioxygenase subunit alpha [Pseudomaricurvus alcaniphilus]|uniref:aromatic ring-hydroxylating dioxygenase subunit alpha n=1 Tax=Pseudomaricurvus alcaniphilus TaxID=1166482 RepID=UPI00140BBF84|nr:aromatic ring-hydroxylating dioxygenase subunit alpha [Pseudomaricurvus alcaniphilus]NHN39893.1 aromatic ring-hydroxylating dioxygenase subunit alpha [Pseudomaricurvus alcaniphilus]